MTTKINKRKIELCKEYKKVVRDTSYALKKEHKHGKSTYDQYFFKLSKFLRGRSEKAWISYYDDTIYKLSQGNNVSHIETPSGIRHHFSLQENILLVSIIALALFSVFSLSGTPTGFAILDAFKVPLIDISQPVYQQNESLLFAVNPSSAGVYSEAYILQNKEIFEIILLDCPTTICTETVVTNKNLSSYPPGRYEIAIFDYEENDYITKGFTVQRQPGLAARETTHDFICLKCSAHKVPPITEIGVILTANNPGGYITLSDYYPAEWNIVDENQGYIIRINSSYNKISWDIESNESSLTRTYTIRSPEKTTPPTDYFFIAEVDGVLDDKWIVKVADPAAITEILVGCLSKSAPSAGSDSGSCADTQVKDLNYLVETEGGVGGPPGSQAYTQNNAEGFNFDSIADNTNIADLDIRIYLTSPVTNDDIWDVKLWNYVSNGWDPLASVTSGFTGWLNVTPNG